MVSKYLLLAIFSFLSFSIFGQLSISGNLQNSDSEPIEFANVLLMNTKDSSFVTSAMSDEDGGFLMKAPKGEYFIHATLIGYQDLISPAFDLQNDKELGALSMEVFATTLETAVVTAKKQFLEQKAGKMIVNVANSIAGQNGSTLDLLKKVPGLVVVRDQVNLAGQTNVTILLDGKQTKYMDVNSLLKDMPASDIEKIEVINQPGAEFDAEGAGGVLNIILKKNVRLGTNGSVKLGAGYGQYFKGIAQLSLNHRQGRLNTYGSTTLRQSSGFDNMDLVRTIENGQFIQENIYPYSPLIGSIRGGLDYDITDKQTIGFSGNYRRSNDRPVQDNRTLFINDKKEPLFRLNTNIKENYVKQTFGADVFWHYKIDTSGQKLEFDASYGGYYKDRQNISVTDVIAGDTLGMIDDIRNSELGKTSLLAFALAYKYPFEVAKVKAKFNAGLKYTMAQADADLLSETRVPDGQSVFVKNNGVSNHFIYDEQIAAAYTSLDLDLGSVSANFGLRFEQTLTQGNSITIDSVFNRNYGKLFPSLGLSGKINGELGWTSAYSYRLRRPDYSDLNPFIYYLNPFTYQRGNTNLKPSYTHNSEVGLTYNGQPFFKLAYQRTTDVISQVTFQDEKTGVTEAYDDNLDTYQRYGGQLFFPLGFISKIDGYAGVLAYYNHYQSDYLSQQLNQGKWNIVGFVNTTFDLPWKIKGEANFYYLSGGQEGIIKFNDLYGSSIGLQRSFMDDQIDVSVSFDDPIYKYWSGSINHVTQQMKIQTSWEVRKIDFSIKYKFGNRYLKKKKRRSSAAQELLDRTN